MRENRWKSLEQCIVLLIQRVSQWVNCLVSLILYLMNGLMELWLTHSGTCPYTDIYIRQLTCLEFVLNLHKYLSVRGSTWTTHVYN